MRKFDEVYEKINQKYSKKFEESRRKYSLFFIISTIILVCAFGYSFKNITSIEPNFLIIIFIVVCIILFAMIRIKLKYEREFKNNIINELIKEFDTGLNYNIRGRISKETFNNSGFKIEYTNIQSEDVIKGRLKENIDIQMGEIRLISQKKYKDGTVEKTTMYNGIFSEITLPIKSSMPKIMIRKKVPNKYETNKLKKIQLESIEFENDYDFYTEDSIEALKIFNIEAIEKIVQIKEKYNKKIEIIFKDNKIYLLFNAYKPFEVRINKKTLDYSLLKEYYEIIEMVGNIGIYFNEILN